MNESPASHAIHHNPEVAVDQELALKAAANRLQDEFGDQLGSDAVEESLRSSYDDVVTQAQIPNFVPLLAERYAREELQTRSSQ